MGHPDVRKRPGGRTAEVTARIHKAIIDIIIDDGVAGCTVSAVAQRAKVERSTLYRRFQDRWDAVIEALMAVAAADVMPTVTGSFRTISARSFESWSKPSNPLWAPRFWQSRRSSRRVRAATIRAPSSTSAWRSSRRCSMPRSSAASSRPMSTARLCSPLPPARSISARSSRRAASMMTSST